MARIVIPDYPHHVTQRSHRGEKVFFSPTNYRRYLKLLSENAAIAGLDIIAYCLMPNHVHMIVVPKKGDSLSITFKTVHMRYAIELNKARNQKGFVWQGRFFSCPMDELHYWAAIRYVERNPVRAKIVREAEKYPWSSASAHCGLRKDPVLSKVLELSQHVQGWSHWLSLDESGRISDVIKQCTFTGRPAGNAIFINRLERITGKKIKRKRPGRPKSHEMNIPETSVPN